ncbi:uncharacterized protein LOC113233928 [Hyposmocoma kahamanoa]|uniref:uncharacterized protein LOC113233928 n=1 Tax=Hyposmocoma kahamanoa TaxID=1477025 RepID=UPI000E6D6303|nr:uncharacterized protein LOC113233928 [Hyposmocoma kahamanoa]
MLVWIWLGCLAAAVLLYFRQVYSFFKRRGVKTPRIIPPFGNSFSIVLQREHISEQIVRIYKEFPDQRFYGGFQFLTPRLLVRDVELIKKIGVKDYEHFLDHNNFVNEESDPMFGRSILSLTGQEWKDMRSTLSPAFTSSKMKMMLPLMVEVGDQLFLSLQKKIKESKQGYLDVDVKDLTSRYANDVIASCAFGLKVNSYKDENSQFYAMGKSASGFGYRQILVFLLSNTLPTISRIFKWSMFSKSVQDFFRSLVMETMQNRELKQIKRPDMIHLLMETKKGKLTHDEKSTHDADAGFATVEESSVGLKQVNRVWSDDDLCAQATLFFVAGFETVSSIMTSLVYELAINPDVQDKLYQEIRENEVKNNGKFDYNSVQNMVYMDMVVSETLRLWPAVVGLDRHCTKDYNLGKPNDTATEDYIIRKGEGIQIPLWAIHRDPKYYPNPDKFDPERFSEENKHKIQPFTYIPFGLGPRNCIGSRFALCEVKVMAYQLFNSIEVSPSNKTVIPRKLDPSTSGIRTKGSQLVRFELRKMLVWIWLGCLVVAVFLYLRQVYGTFKRQGVKTSKIIPPFGTMTRILLQREHFTEQITKTYNQFSDQRFYGAFQFLTPFLQVRDIELIKKITVKDFEHFLDHNVFINEECDPLFGRNLISLRGQEWKDMRSTLSPAFTSSKMKMMLPLMVEVGDQMILSLEKKIQECKQGYLDIDVKDLTTRYANDVIASCVFGLKVDSHKDEHNQFYLMGKNASTFSFRQLLVFLLSNSFPNVAAILKWSMFPESVQNFFRTLVKETMQNRELKHIIRPDMIHLLMEAKKGKLTHEEKASDKDVGFATAEESSVGRKQINKVWSDDDLCAQAVLFFLAGFETISSVMSFLMYELAVNPDIQEKLYKEIRENEDSNKGQFDYNSIQNMVYMDMVVSETMRLWPPNFNLDRYCNKDYNLGKPNDKATHDFVIREGDGLQIPVWAIHRDPKYYPNPDNFDPDRFSEETKYKIQPFTYMPFGLGPRNCIGSRFALCEVKVMAYQFLSSFEVSPSKRTIIPPKLDPSSFTICIKGGHWIQLKARKVA